MTVELESREPQQAPPAPSADSPRLLDNVAWHALAGPQAEFALGTTEARRYSRGFSAIVGFADLERPAFAALRPFCDPGDQFHCVGWSGAAPPGWRIEFESAICKMIWDAAVPAADAAFAPVRLGTQHIAQMLALVGLTRPGPFGPRTIELGEYVGCFEGERLVAMAGERMCAGAFREVSGVCTHPAYQGRGLARRLIETLIRREMDRGETPFLHVLRSNVNAVGMYERMGFRHYREATVRVVSFSG
jgi:GNAT superfamily N-acetyltransferase